MKKTIRAMAGSVLLLAVLSSTTTVQAQITFRNITDGTVLNLDDARPDGKDTPGVKQFLQTGRNPYNEKPACLKKGEELLLTACSACHGHYAEGKIGPSLTDDYWTYPEGKTDEGFFSIVFGGARAQMGPQYLALTLDEMLQVMAWVRHMYHGPVDSADWMTVEQKKNYKPWSKDDPLVVPEGAACAP
jgi:cytochrome c-L